MKPVSIAELRRNKDYPTALRRLISLCKNTTPTYKQTIPSKLFQHLVRECLVLDWAAHKIAIGQRGDCEDTLKELQDHVAPCLGDSLKPQFLARLALIRATSDPHGQTSLQDAIEGVVQAVTTAWNYQPVTFPNTNGLPDYQTHFSGSLADTRLGPLFLWNLPDGYREILQQLAVAHSWLHPGLLLAGETLAVLEGVSPRSNHAVHSHTMFAFESQTDCFGVLAPFTVERIQRPTGSAGHGVLIPDARKAAYLTMQKSYSDGLQQVGYAAWITKGNQPLCDFRWSIDLWRGVHKTKLSHWFDISLQGASSEGVLTCAVRLARAGGTMDRNTSMSARLVKPIEPSLALNAIESLDVKCLSPQPAASQPLSNWAAFQRSRVKRIIKRIIVSDLQPDDDCDTGSGHDFLRVKSVFDAEEEFQLWPTITREVKANLVQRAEQHREALCGAEPPTPEERRENGRSYVQSPVSYRPVRSSEQQEKLIPLSDEEIRRFVLGRWRPNDPTVKLTQPIRIRLFADSGMGKSVQLVVCEHRIAQRADDRVPIRIGKSFTHRVGQERLRGSTSVETIAWNQPEEQVLLDLARKCLGDAIPEVYRDKVAEWIKRKAENGELVFLIDALDQTAGDLEALAKFLRAYPACPVIATGRPESVHTRVSLFSQQDWWTLDLRPLGPAEQRKLLGVRLADDLVAEDDDEDEEDVDTGWRHQLKELLAVPLLLEMIKRQVRTQGIDNFNAKNRYQLYRDSARELLKKGLASQDSATGTSSPLSLESEVKSQLKPLQDLAWTMTRKHEFQVLEGDRLTDWIEESNANLAELIQVDMVTMHGFLDRLTAAPVDDWTGPIEPGIEWRHRSFQEYFAGCELARLWSSDQRDEQEQAEQALRDVHEVLDQYGAFKTWSIWDPKDRCKKKKFLDLPSAWRWVLRFALMALDDAQRESLAKRLIGLGNPWVVYQSINSDDWLFDVKFDSLVRRLVHQPNNLSSVNYDKAISRFMLSCTLPEHKSYAGEVDLVGLNCLNRSTRDAATLSPLRSLVGDDVFFAGYSRENSLLEQMRCLKGGLTDLAGWNFLASFVPVLGGVFDITTCHKEFASMPDDFTVVNIPNFSLSDFPVTNELFELFCPTHRRLRDHISKKDDQPVVWVNWFVANEFCHWLSALTGELYRLPTEWEWEWACRWLCQPNESPHAYLDCWWGLQLDTSLCWCVYEGKARRVCREGARSRSQAIKAFNSKAASGVKHPSWRSNASPGLLDQLGNVCEFVNVDNLSPDSAGRLTRGGSFFNDPRSCRMGSYSGLPTSIGYFNTGFRVAKAVTGTDQLAKVSASEPPKCGGSKT